MSYNSVFFMLIWLHATITLAQQDKDYLKMIRREPIRAMRKWIACDVCKLAMKSINRRARSMRDALKYEQLEEEHYSNITRYACQPYHDHGDWITKLDIVKKGKGKGKSNTLSVTQKDVYGRCSHECETIALACQHLIEQYEEEIPEFLYSKISTAKLQKKVCRSSCKKKQKKPKFQSEWGNEAFEEIADDQRQMFRSFVMGELHKREEPKDDQQDYLQRYAEAYIEQEETVKQQKAAKRRYDNKMRARKGLPPLPEEDEDEDEDDDDDDDKLKENENENGDEGGIDTDVKKDL